MKNIYCLGEALVDFISEENELKRYVGGAVANVACTVSALGGQSHILASIGGDSLGTLIIKEIRKCKTDLNYTVFYPHMNTMSTVVANQKTNRTFEFYRNNTADMYYPKRVIKDISFTKDDILHFGSIAYVKKTKQAMDLAIKLAKKNNAIISFDVNIRLPLIKNKNKYKKNINKLILTTDILKVSDEEISFITDEDIAKGIESLRQKVTLLIVTKGEKGSSIYTKTKEYHTDAIVTDVVDTTGAGDGYLGAFLYQLQRDDIKKEDLENIDFTKYMEFSTLISSKIIAHVGAISALHEIIDKRKK